MFPVFQVANILLNGMRYDSNLSDSTETIDTQMSMKLLCIAIYRMPPSLRSLCINHFLGKKFRRNQRRYTVYPKVSLVINEYSS